MRDIVFFNWAYIYIPKYDITISDSEEYDHSVSLSRGWEDLSDTMYWDDADWQQSMDNVIDSLQKAGYEIIRF